MYATKYSLAELMEVMGDEKAANVLRQNIIDTYDPQGADDENKSDSSNVKIETTKATTRTKQNSK